MADKTKTQRMKQNVTATLTHTHTHTHVHTGEGTRQHKGTRRLHRSDSDSYMGKQFLFFASFLLLLLTTTLSVFLTPLLHLLLQLLLLLLPLIILSEHSATGRASLPSVPPTTMEESPCHSSGASVPSGGDVHSPTSSLFSFPPVKVLQFRSIPFFFFFFWFLLPGLRLWGLLS